MEKFTKGEWGLSEPENKGNYIQIEVGAFYSTVCFCVGSTNPMLDTYAGASQVKANAHLISAAPDMYRALRGVADKLPFTPNQFGGGYSITLTQAEVDAIRAALAKADGE